MVVGWVGDVIVSIVIQRSPGLSNGINLPYLSASFGTLISGPGGGNLFTHISSATSNAPMKHISMTATSFQYTLIDLILQI